MLEQPSHCGRCKEKIVSGHPFCPKCSFDIRHGTEHRIAKGNCLYCKKYGPLSEEHIFGRWLAERYPNPNIFNRILGRNSFDDGRAGELHELVEPEKAHAYHWTVPNVCKDCNNDWMSSIHGAARATVIELAEGAWPELSEDTRKIISCWAAMIAVNLQSYTRMVFTPDWQLEQLMKREVPFGFRVYIHRMVTDKYAGYHNHRPQVTSLDPDEGYLNFCSTFFVIESVAFHLIYGTGPMKLDCAIQLECENPNVFEERMIWPYDVPPVNESEGYTGEIIEKLQQEFLPRSPVSTISHAKKRRKVVQK